jgi:bifunctional non-homologous end joining protein LigD
VLPHLRDRPFTLKQHFNGPRSPFRWLKDAPPELPRWIATSPQPARSRGGALVRYVVVQDEASLLWLVDYGCIDLHVWSSRLDRPESPDWLVFDFDPARGAAFSDVVRAALVLRDALDALGLVSVPMTTGGDGMHVRVPLARGHAYPEVRRFAGAVALALARSHPDLVTVERVHERRAGVFVDTKMNGHGQQIVAPYSVRPGTKPCVATPLAWDEVVPGLAPQAFRLRAVHERFERLGDLAAPLLAGSQRLEAALARL